MFALFFILGLAAAAQKSGLTVYEPLINLAIPYAPSSLYSLNPLGGFYSGNPVEAQQYQPMSPPQGTRLSDVYDRPVVVLYAPASNRSALTAYIAPRGIASLADAPHTRRLHQEIREQQRNLSAIVFRPSAFRYTAELLRVGGRPVVGVSAPQGLKLATLTRLAGCDIPLLLVAPKQEFAAVERLQQLRTVGEIQFAEDNSVGIECAYYSPC